jgi:hypothetical protein
LTWSSARAAVKVDVMVDGVAAIPGQVVFCDRAQYVGLTLDTTCELSGSLPTDAGCTVTDTLLLELFQKTKSANHFNFYIPNKAVATSAAMHKVDVIVHGEVECLDSKNSTTCSESTFGTAVGKTKAVIGKATLAVEDINNSNLLKCGGGPRGVAQRGLPLLGTELRVRRRACDRWRPEPDRGGDSVSRDTFCYSSRHRSASCEAALNNEVYFIFQAKTEKLIELEKSAEISQLTVTFSSESAFNYT